MSGQDIAFAVIAVVGVAAEIAFPRFLRTRRPAARPGSGRMAERPRTPAPGRDPSHIW